MVREITELVFKIEANDKEDNDKLRVNLLCCLFGINVPTASAILALVYPKNYAIIDRKNLRFLYPTKNADHKKRTFTIAQYLNYLSDIRGFAKEYRLDPQIIDMAIWEKESLS